MRKFDRLKRKARHAALSRGHSMSVFRTVAWGNPTMGVRGRVAVAECAHCGAWANVELREGIGRLAGNALQLHCISVWGRG